jgi:hypothetical protein
VVQIADPLAERYIVGIPLLRRQHMVTASIPRTPGRRGERKFDHVAVNFVDHPEVIAAADCTGVKRW